MPAEGAAIDDLDQDPGHDDSQRDGGDAAQQSNAARLHGDHAADLAGRHAERTQGGKLPGPLQLQGEHRREDADERDAHGQPVEHVGYDEGLVEYLQRQLANAHVRVNANLLRAGAERLHRGNDIVRADAVGEIQAERIDAVVIEMPIVGRPTHHDGARVDVIALVSREHLEVPRARVGRQRDASACAEFVVVGIGLRDQDSIPVLPGRPHVSRIRVQDLGAGVASGRHANGDELRAAAGLLDPAAAAGARGFDPIDALQRLEQAGVERASLHARIDVGLQRLLEPAIHRTAKTIDHDAHANRRRQRYGERDDRHARAAQAGRDPADGKPRRHAREPVRDRRKPAGKMPYCKRHAGRETEDQQEYGSQARHEIAARHGEQYDCRQQNNQPARRHIGQKLPRSSFERGARQREARLVRRRLQRGDRGSSKRGADAGDESLGDGRGCNADARHADAEVEIVDRAGDKGQQLFAKQHSQRNAEQRRDDPEQPGLRENDGEQLPARDAEAPENTNQVTALQYREADAVEDQEQPDEQGQQAHRRQVGHESLAHFGSRARSPGCGEQAHTVG